MVDRRARGLARMQSTARMLACPDENTLSAMLEGSLDAAARAQVLEHVDGCNACREAVADWVCEDTGADDPLHPVRLAPGAMLGRYTVLRILGAGATGVVYAAHDPELNRNVALKVLRTDVFEHPSEERRARLLREAQALARLSHPHVITVYEVGAIGAAVFIAMELVEGGTLRSWLADGRRSAREVLDVFLQAGEGLAAAHSAGLVHRDFKPDNVLLGAEGRVRVTDFGLARNSRQILGPSNRLSL